MTRPDGGDASAADMLTLDLLAWLGSARRSYTEAMEAWRTSCPRLSIWEDALEQGFIQVDSEPGKPIAQAAVTLTPRGRATLDESSSRETPIPVILS